MVLAAWLPSTESRPCLLAAGTRLPAGQECTQILPYAATFPPVPSGMAGEPSSPLLHEYQASEALSLTAPVQGEGACGPRQDRS